MSIDRSNFSTWKMDPVTKEIFLHLEVIVLEIEEKLADPRFIMSAAFESYAKYYAGRLDALYDVLNISYADLDIKEEPLEHA